jgi:hypothetical protein
MGEGQNVPITSRGLFPFQELQLSKGELHFNLLLLQYDSYLVPIWSIRSLCDPYLILHSYEIRMWALSDPGPCLVPMWSYLSSPIMVPMRFLCAPFEVLALSIMVHPWSARSLLRDSYKVPDRS